MNRRLGQLLVGCGFLLPEQLDAALAEQTRHPSRNIRLGTVVVQQGWVEQHTVDYLVTCSHYGSAYSNIPLGLHLVLSGMISRPQLEQALELQRQQSAPERLGEILEKLGYSSRRNIDYFKTWALEQPPVEPA